MRVDSISKKKSEVWKDWVKIRNTFAKKKKRKKKRNTFAMFTPNEGMNILCLTEKSSISEAEDKLQCFLKTHRK